MPEGKLKQLLFQNEFSGQPLFQFFEQLAVGREFFFPKLGVDMHELLELPAGNPLRAKAHFSLHAENASELLLGWLRELLFTFSTKRYVLLEYNFTELTDQTLVADAQGFIFDPKRHDQKCEIKAVTYHNFKLEKIKEGFVAEIIFDI